MGLLARLLGRPEQRAITAATMETAGVPIGQALSEHYGADTLNANLGTVVACINAVAGTMAAQPAYVYRRSEAGRVEAPSHPVARLIRQPNPHQTWADWLEWIIGEVLSRGNALSIVETDGAGRPIALTPVPWSHVSPLWSRSGRLVFDVAQYATPWGGVTERRRLLAEEVFHLKDRSDDGIIGRSRISRAPGVIQNAAALQAFSVAQWQNQATPSGALQFDGPLTPEALDRVRENLKQRHAGTGNARSIMLLPGGSRWVSLSVSPEDAEVLASRRFSREELASLYGVPAPVVGILDHATFTNSETLLRFFAQQTLAGWCRKVELEFARSVFGTSSGDYSLEISLDGLLRGDPAQRWAGHKIAVEAGILTPNECREIEGFNPRPEAANAA
ncbi:phage portal protein [Belnapia sp. T18]|uniref:Phage portal protein n=1 Tax=Belnapia arida TaxID=2804533 RepID=A0ABS1UGR8_9PROT|nr:phage portal protein [Belnapia arida]MBL6082481.1 phage portal protein [Belnapia arida]